MRTVVVEQPFQQTVSLMPQSSGSASAYLLIVPLSVFGGAAAAYGFSILTELAFSISLLVAAFLYSIKMHFLRHQTPQEQMMNNSGNRMAGYMITAFLFVALAAFGLFEYSRAKIAASEIRQPNALRLQAATGQTRDAFSTGFEATAEERSNFESRSRPDRPIEFRGTLGNEPVASNQDMETAQPEPVSSNRSTTAPSGHSTGSPASGEGFIRATLMQDSNAIGCWIALLITEALVWALVYYNRPRYVFRYV